MSPAERLTVKLSSRVIWLFALSIEAIYNPVTGLPPFLVTNTVEPALTPPKASRLSTVRTLVPEAASSANTVSSPHILGSYHPTLQSLSTNVNSAEEAKPSLNL